MYQNFNVNIFELNEETQNKVDNISIVTFNMQSLRGKFLEFANLINSLIIQFTFIVLTEVWLSENLYVKINISPV